MTDNKPIEETAQEWEQRMFTDAGGLSHEYVLPYAYPIVDAALWEFLTALLKKEPTSSQFTRHRTTEGSVAYTLFAPGYEKRIPLADLQIRMVGEQKTYVSIEARPTLEDVPANSQRALQAYCDIQLIAFVTSIWIDADRMAKLAAATPTPENTRVSVDEHGNISNVMPSAIREAIRRNTGGRPRQSDDDWAWEQVHIHHRPHKEVKKEWRQRNKESMRILKEETQAWSRATKPDRMKKLGS